MAINTFIPAPIQNSFAPQNHAPNGMTYPNSIGGRTIGATLGAITGLASSNTIGTGIPAVDTVVMTAIGTGVGAAVDYMINKQRQEIVGQLNIQA